MEAIGVADYPQHDLGLDIDYVGFVQVPVCDLLEQIGNPAEEHPLHLG